MDFLSEAKNINTLISVCVYKLHVVISVIYCFSFTKSKRKSHPIPFGMYTVRQDVYWTCTMVCLFSLWEIIPFLRKQNQNKQTSLQTKYMYKLFFCQKFWHHMYYSHHFQCVKYHTNATWQSRINPQNLILASRHFFSTMDFVLQTYMYGQNFCPDRLHVHVHTIPYILLLLKWQISLQWQPLCNAKSFHPWVAVTERFYYTVKKNHFFPYHGAHIWTNNTLYLTMMLTAPVHHGSYSTMYLAYYLLFSDNNECFLLVANMHTIIHV